MVRGRCPRLRWVQAVGLKSSEHVASTTIGAPSGVKQALKAPTIIAEGNALGYEQKKCALKGQPSRTAVPGS
jgi:hypothetical protein